MLLTPVLAAVSVVTNATHYASQVSFCLLVYLSQTLNISANSSIAQQAGMPRSK